MALFSEDIDWANINEVSNHLMTNFIEFDYQNDCYVMEPGVHVIYNMGSNSALVKKFTDESEEHYLECKIENATIGKLSEVINKLKRADKIDNLLNGSRD